MSIVSEIAARVQANVAQREEADKNVRELGGTMPAITLSDYPNARTYTQKATPSGNLSLYVGDHRSEFTPAEARRLAVWILQNFTD